MQHVKHKLAAVLMAVFAVLGVGVSAPVALASASHASVTHAVTVAPAAHPAHTIHLVSGSCFYWADSGNHAYLNAWGGGPFVDVYHSCANPQGYFSFAYNGPYVQLKYTGSGSWAGKCIGDAYNDPTFASTSLDGCGSNPGWGVNLTIYTTGYCAQGQAAFWDNHWGGWLGPPNPYGDGAPWFLNKGGYFCYDLQ